MLYNFLLHLVTFRNMVEVMPIGIGFEAKTIYFTGVLVSANDNTVI